MSTVFASMIPGAMTRGKPMTVHAPYDGTEIAVCETADYEAVETALKTSYALFRDRDRWLPLSDRLSILEKAMEIMKSRAEELAVEAAREGGKPLIDSRVEVTRA